MGQFLYWSNRRGKPFIRTYFKGDAVDAGAEDHSDGLASGGASWSDTMRGISLPWNLTSCIAIGVLLMFSRLLLGTTDAMANANI